MDRNNIIIAVLSVVLIALAGVTAYTLFFNEHYETVQVSETASLEMPVGNGIKSEYLNNSSIYVVYNGHTEIKEKILSYNSNNKGLSDAMAYAMLRTLYCSDVENQIVEQDINGTHYYSIATGNNDTHDNIIITSTNKEKTQKMYESIKYSQSNNTNNTTNNTNTTDKVEHISSDQQVESQSSSQEQYIGEDGQPISEADYKTLKVYGKSANSQEEWEAQKARLGY